MKFHFPNWLSRGLAFGALLTAVGSAFSQLPAAPGINLFGDDIVIKPAAQQGQNAASLPLPPSPGLGQSVFFPDGAQLRGELVSLEKGEIRWNRPGFSAPFPFASEQLRKIVLGSEDGWIESDLLGPKAANERPLRATVELVGGDWLFGDLSSSDGISFDLKVGDRIFKLQRSQIETIRMARHAAPEFNGCGGIDRPIERYRTGFLVLPNGQYLGPLIPGRGSFALAFELEKGSDEGVTLEFHPSGPDPKYGYKGSDYIRLGEKELAYSIRSPFKKDDVVRKSLPAAAQQPGHVRYFILYDAMEQRFRVYRDGCLTLDFSRLESDLPANPSNLPPALTSA
ncbi:MAG TPA: hypothetical protein VGH90_07850, partial [Chthoniobacteraceae bacterium]